MTSIHPDAAISDSPLETPHRRPAIPNTPQRRQLERDRGIRDIIFGAQDGVLTALGLVTGLGAAQHDRATLLIAGLLTILVGALSMGVGEFLGSKTEREVVQHTIDLERREMIESPDAEIAEQVAYYIHKGFTREEAEMILRRLAQHPDIWLHEMVRDEFGIDPRVVEEGGVGSALWMAGSFAVGAAIPILPHLTPLTTMQATVVGFVLSAVMLFTIGAIAARSCGRHPLPKGLEIAGVGFLVFLISWAAGYVIPAFFGHAPIAP